MFRKLKKYGDAGFLFRIFCFAGKLDLTPDRFLLKQLDAAPQTGKGKDEETVSRYVNLCLLIRKKLGFRDACLKTSLLLCRFLRRYGIKARVCFGAKKENGRMQGHCWVETDNPGEAGEWQTVFRYPQRGGGKRITIMDEHTRAYWIWKEENVRNRILVHLDAHMDCNVIPEKDIDSILSANSLDELNALLESPGYWDLSGKPREQRIAAGNFIFPALREAMVKEVYWIVPDHSWEPEKCAQIFRDVFGKYPSGRAQALDNIRISERKVTSEFNEQIFTCCRLADMPKISQKVLLDIDLDYLIKNGEYSSTHEGKEPWIGARELAEKIKEKEIRSDLITIACSVKDGFTPEKYRYLADELAEELEAVNR